MPSERAAMAQMSAGGQIRPDASRPARRVAPSNWYEGIVALHRTAGNAAVGRLLQPGREGDHRAFPIAQAGLRSAGQPLAPAIRSVMEARFGQNFGNVRVHADRTADEAAGALGAQAYTLGADIVVAANQGPGTADGQRLLAHELTHVVQQEGRTGGSRAAAETEAQAAAGQVMSGLPASVRAAAPSGVQCQARGKGGSADDRIVRRLEQIDRRLERIALSERSGFITSYEMQLGKDLMRERATLLLRLHKLRHPTTDVTFADEEGEVITADPAQVVAEQVATYESALAEDTYPEGLLIFPFRPSRGIWRVDVASVRAERRGEDIHVSQPLNAVRNTARFRAEAETLPMETFLGGIDLPARQIVGVKLYDEGGKVVLVRAEHLLDVSKASERAVLLNIGLTAADVLGGPLLGKAAGKGISLLARKVLQPGLVAAMIGTAEAAPTAFGGFASRTGVTLVEQRAAAEVVGGVAARAVSPAVEVAEGQAVRATTSMAAGTAVPALTGAPLAPLAARGAGVTTEAVGRTAAGILDPVATGGGLRQGGLEVIPTPKQSERLGRVAEALADETKWGNVTGRDRLRLGRVYDNLLEQLVAEAHRESATILHYAELTAAKVAELRAAGGRVLVTEGRIALPGAAKLKRFDLLRIDFTQGTAELVDITATSSAKHIAKTRAYKTALQDLLGMDVEATELIYTGSKGELLEELIPIPVR